MNQELFNKAIQRVTSPLPGSTPESVSYRLTVKEKFEGLNIVDFFTKAVPRSTPKLWEEKVIAGNLKVNNKLVAIDYVVKAGDLTLHSSEPKVEPDINPYIELIYACKDFWVLNKPSPLPMHASGRFSRNTLINILELAFPDEEFKVIHRIDANTTGLVVIAKNKVSANNIREQFENKSVQKQYIALIEGIIDTKQNNLVSSIGTEVLVGGARKIDSKGKKASTDIEVLEKRKDTTLLKVTPHTGRTNQIRLHLAELGHPIVGDIGHKDPNYFKTNPFTYPTDSLFLHAYKINFKHPISSESVSFKAAIPKKFNT